MTENYSQKVNNYLPQKVYVYHLLLNVISLCL